MHGKGAYVDAVQAAHIHVDLVRIGSRHIERMHSAMPAECVLGRSRVESIGGEIVHTAHALKVLGCNNEMQEALLAAQGTVTIGRTVEIGAYAEPHASAMASAFVNLRHCLTVQRRGIEAASTGVQLHSSSSCPNKPNCAGSRAGSGKPRCRNAWPVKSRPRGVRWMKPFWIRNGSMISSMASRCSDSAAAMVSIPTGPPA